MRKTRSVGLLYTVTVERDGDVFIKNETNCAPLHEIVTAILRAIYMAAEFTVRTSVE